MNKHVTLADAVRETVTPGAQIIFSFSHNRAHAAAFEVARQFKDTEALELVGTGLIEYASVLASAGAIKRMESAFMGNSYPAPAPAKVLCDMVESGGGHDPNWTNLTLPLRLMAGAFGWPFIPVHSLLGSGLGEGKGRAEIENPFGEGSVGVIAPLVPDVAFVHGAIADTHGNTVVYGPHGEDLWGAWAAKKVVVTAEKVVDPEEFRKLGPRPGFPGHRVTRVVEVPYGAHPQAQFVWNDDGVRPYAEDYEMRSELRRLSRKPDEMRAWVEEWVFGQTHESYLERLGKDYLEELNTAAFMEADSNFTAPDTGPPTPEEVAATVAMREAVSKVVGEGYELLFAGIGLSHIAAWAAEELCRAKGYHPMLVAETGLYGFRPAKGDPYLFNPPNTRSSLFHSDFTHTLGILGGPRSERCLTMLGAGQMDSRGNVNSSWIGGKNFIVGAGGANDLVKGNSDYMVVMPASSRRLIENVDFVTSPVGSLACVATDLGILELSKETGELEIAAVVTPPGKLAEGIEKFRGACGWDVKVKADPRRLNEPEPGELALLRSFDPEKKLLG
ncbi:MAG: 3-oxoacid CoA-transferase [Deltaproteobacteria bacterium]|nr:MAG: 3-oxoacid CoA-transferase [Deltaproteobacteria bacterium]